MKITKEFLESKNACTDGVAAFCKMFPDGFDLSEWTRDKQIEIVKTDLRKFLGWAFSEGVIPLWLMDGASLTRANLDGANLDGASLTRANLTRASLTRANLYGANLDGANLTRANLDGANLDGASLTRASLYGANLDGARYTKFTVWPKGFDPVAAGAKLVE